MPLTPRVTRLNAVIPAAHQRVFAALLRVNEELHYNAVLRVAGGWVRDMLLHVPSNDIDVAIETPPGATQQVSGELFARGVAESLGAEEGARERSVSVIRANPAKSKHIETATVCVHDIPVEFCALRADDYCNDSRVPCVRPGTPLEDAQRRDYTVNALFYNLHTGDVEDYTTGLEDLQGRLLRCPLDPRKTFQDDPLRLLRGVRFVGQLGNLNFHLDSSVSECVDAPLLSTLLQKVSRERIGKEVTKMLSGARPEKCVEILYSLSLLQSVLLVEVHLKKLPGTKKVSADIDCMRALGDGAPQNAFALLLQLNRVVSPSFSGDSSLFRFATEEEKLVAMLFVLLIPFFRGSLSQAAQEERLYAVVVNGLKMPLVVHNGVRRMVECYNALLREELTITELLPQGSCTTLADATKLKVFSALSHLNDSSVIPAAFKVTLFTYVVAEGHASALEQRQPDEAAAFFQPLWALLASQPKLLSSFQEDLPLKGNELKRIRGIEPKDIGRILLEMRRLQVLNPNVSREAAEEWILQTFVKPRGQ